MLEAGTMGSLSRVATSGHEFRRPPPVSPVRRVCPEADGVIGRQFVVTEKSLKYQVASWPPVEQTSTPRLIWPSVDVDGSHAC